MEDCYDCKYGRWIEDEKYFCSYPFKYDYVEGVRWCSWRESERDSYYDEDEDDDDYGSSWCYITTATCNILGMDDDNYYLNTLRDFRNNFMKKDSKYLKMLVLYDIVGPKISKALKKDEDSLEIAGNIIDNIKVAVSDINNKEYDKAIERYMNMTVGLAEYYGIFVPEVQDEFIENISIDKAGTGKLYQKKIST